MEKLRAGNVTQGLTLAQLSDLDQDDDRYPVGLVVRQSGAGWLGWERW